MPYGWSEEPQSLQRGAEHHGLVQGRSAQYHLMGDRVVDINLRGHHDSNHRVMDFRGDRGLEDFDHHDSHISSSTRDDQTGVSFVEERPMRILVRETKELRNRVIPHVKIQWSHHEEREVTWEPKDEKRISHLYLFETPSLGMDFSFEDETFCRRGGCRVPELVTVRVCVFELANVSVDTRIERVPFCAKISRKRT